MEIQHVDIQSIAVNPHRPGELIVLFTNGERISTNAQFIRDPAAVSAWLKQGRLTLSEPSVLRDAARWSSYVNQFIVSSTRTDVQAHPHTDAGLAMRGVSTGPTRPP